jgi:hypothetical protein
VAVAVRVVPSLHRQGHRSIAAMRPVPAVLGQRGSSSAASALAASTTGAGAYSGEHHSSRRGRQHAR